MTNSGQRHFYGNDGRNGHRGDFQCNFFAPTRWSRSWRSFATDLETNRLTSVQFHLLRNPPATTRTKLPTIELTKLDGDRQNWSQFWCAFESAVHNNSELWAMKNFCNLASLLTSSAAAEITGLPMTEHCCNNAVEKLRKRFSDQTHCTIPPASTN